MRLADRNDGLKGLIMHSCKHMLHGLQVLAVIGAITGPAHAGVPGQISHQGVVTVNGQRFQDPNGTLATFYFALVSNSGNGTNLWTNDGSSLGTLNRPIGGVQQVSVVDGVYSVSLGGGTMASIPVGVFNNANVVLRIWFNDGSNDVQQLAPDHSLASVPYAQHSALEPPIGSIIAWHENLPGGPALTLPDGWVRCNGGTISDVLSPIAGRPIPDLNNTPTGGYSGGGRFLRGATSSGTMQEGSAHWDAWEVFGSAVPGNSTFGVVNADGVRMFGSSADNVGFLNGNNMDLTYQFSRPVNMSVVWIMRVK